MTKVADLFKETKKVVADYTAKEKELIHQEKELHTELDALERELTANLLDQETASLSEKIYLKARAKQIKEQAEIIAAMQEEVQEAKTALKLDTVPKLREARGKDAEVRARYNVNDIVARYKWELFNEIADIGKQVNDQYRKIAPDLMEILDDPAVSEKHRNIKYHFSSEAFKPQFWEANKTVVHREDVRLACGGNLPSDLRKPEGVE